MNQLKGLVKPEGVFLEVAVMQTLLARMVHWVALTMELRKKK